MPTHSALGLYPLGNPLLCLQMWIQDSPETGAPNPLGVATYESNHRMYTSYEYEEEYGPFLYNATWILDNCLIQDGHLVVENEIEICPFLYNVTAIPGHLQTKWNLVILFVHSCTMRLLFLDIYQVFILFATTKCPSWIRQLSRIHIAL